MLKKLTLVATCSCALTVLSMALHAQASDVPPGHWAFEAVEDLASKGLVLGYPDGTFMGQRALTRYEMAAIVQRILKQVDEKGKTAPAISSSADADSTPKVTPEQLAEIAKLVEEYKVELTVMGTDLASVKEQVGLLRQDFDTLKGDFDPVKSTVLDPEGGLQTVINDVAKMKKITVSGYIQARYFSAARQANTAIAPYSGGLYANRNDFQVRRARLKVTATPSKYITAVGQIDFPTNSAEAVSLKDAYVTYNIGGVPDIYPQVSIGQMNWPFGFEVPRSSSDRETPERSEFLRTLFPGERDRGIKISAPLTSRLQYELGLFSGTGTENRPLPFYNAGTFTDNNGHKDWVGHVRYKVNDSLNVNVSGYWGQAGGNTYTPTGGTAFYVPLQDKKRYGADFQWYSAKLPVSVFGEYVKAADEPVLASGATSAAGIRNYDQSGWYLQGNWSLNKNWTLVAKHDSFDPGDWGSYGTVSSNQLGAIRWLDDNTKLKFMYLWRDEDRTKLDNNVAVMEIVTKF